jgi:hypothetical protein
MESGIVSRAMLTQAYTSLQSIISKSPAKLEEEKGEAET